MNNLVEKFMKNMKELTRKEYLYNIITYGIAPTLGGYKCATLINFTDRYMDSYELWKSNKEEFLSNIPLKYFELTYSRDVFTVLFYNKESLNKILTMESCLNFLSKNGYEGQTTMTDALNTLKCKYANGCPHEIGLFLGIPLHDVLGFIKNSGKNYLYCGYWKVYEDVEGAKEMFEAYSKTKIKVMELVGEGNNPFEVIKSF